MKALPKWPLRLFVAVLTLGFGAEIGFGKLAPTKLSKLLDESDLILQAFVTRAALGDDGQSGYAVLKVQQVHKGTFKAPTITVRWEAEEHDQRIPTVGERRLLFLHRKNDGAYSGTHYGRSYWPIKQDPETNKAFTPCFYPIYYLELDIPGIVVKKANLVVGNTASKIESIAVDAIFIDDVIKYAVATK